jgi:hypothetical protein
MSMEERAAGIRAACDHSPVRVSKTSTAGSGPSLFSPPIT